MVLVPCLACRRHVSVDEAACPFCGGAPPAAPARPVLGGRMSRAAVFASATLASCYVAPEPQRVAPPPPPPPNEGYLREEQPPPPPPDDVNYAKPPAASGVIRGVITDDRGAPVAGISVYLQRTGAPAVATMTNRTGEYTFGNLVDGTYVVMVPRDDATTHPRHAPAPDRRPVTIANGGTMQIDIALRPIAIQPDVKDFDRNHCCKPYGAPPARRRVV
jgi:hypothetical protein